MSRFFANPFKDYDASTAAVALPQQDSVQWKIMIEMYLQEIHTKQPPQYDCCEGASLYTGYGGIAYMYLHLATSDIFADRRTKYLELAKQYVDIACDFYRGGRSKKAEEAFLSGPLGVHAVAACIYNELNKDAQSSRLSSASSEKVLGKLAKKVADLTTAVSAMSDVALSSLSDELFVGKAGYLCAVELLQRFGLHRELRKDPVEMYRVVLADGEKYVREKHKRCRVGDRQTPLMYAYHDKEYLGAAHGVAGILKVLITVNVVDQPQAEAQLREKNVQATVDFLLHQCKQSNGNFPTNLAVVRGEASSRPENEELVHFCHGATGCLLMFLAAFNRWGNPEYLEAAVECSEVVWKRGLLRKGPGLCHGVAGNGYAFLQLYRTVKSNLHDNAAQALLRQGRTLDAESYLYRAKKFAEFLDRTEFKEGARTPDSPWSLFEGIAGTVCFLCDVMQPEKSRFPLFDVFPVKNDDLI